MSDVPSDRPGSSATFPEECRRFLRNSRSRREFLSLIVSSSSSNKVSHPLPRLKPQMLTQRQSERWFPQGFGCFFIIKGHPCPPIQSHNWEDPTFKGEQEWREADVLLFGSGEPAHEVSPPSTDRSATQSSSWGPIHLLLVDWDPITVPNRATDSLRRTPPPSG